MISYTQALSNLQSFAKYNTNDTTANTLIMQLFNDSIRKVCVVRSWWFLYFKKDISTVASQATYPVPVKMREIGEVYVTVGTTTYRPRPIYEQESWTRIKQANLGEADTFAFYTVNGNELEFSPTPATSSNTITIKGRMNVRDISLTDYTTGTITAVTNGGTTITGSGTSWNSSMIGRLIRITNTATVNNGDGLWYEISAVGSTTSLTIKEPYEGTTISGGSAAYTISEVMPIPEAWQMAPIYRTMALWSAINDPQHPAVANTWWKLFDGGEEAGLSRETGGILAQMKEVEGSIVADKYLPSSYKDINPNIPPRDITGFA